MDTLSPYAQHSFVEGTENNSWSNMFRFIPDGSRVLDVGCSTGGFGEALQKYKNCVAVGVDISEPDIAEAKKRLTEAHVLDIRDASAQSTLGTFDIVVFGDVIEHLPDPREVLGAVHGLLKPGGAVVYSIPNMAHSSVRFDLMDGRFPYSEIGLLDKTHLHFYDRVEVESVFADSGFAILDELPTVSTFPEPWMTQRLEGLGLTPSPTFYAMLESTDGHVFQYVGIAFPAETVEFRPARTSQRPLPPDEITRRTNELIVANDRLERQLQELYARIARLRRNPIGGIAHELRRRRDKREG